MKRAARVIVGLGLIAVLLYAAVLAVLYSQQIRLIYPGWSRGTRRFEVADSGYRVVETRTADGQRGRMLYRAPQKGRPVILFFHGNGDNATAGVALLRRFTDIGYGAAIPEYRGYDGLAGSPSEQGLYQDARAAREWLEAHGGARNGEVLIGYSLGTGIATQLAADRNPGALVLLAPFASMTDVVRRHFWWVPAILVTQHYDSASKIGDVHCPILVLHGMQDATVPVASSSLLLAAQPHAERVVYRGVGHELGFLPAAHVVVLTWLAQHGA